MKSVTPKWNEVPNKIPMDAYSTSDTQILMMPIRIKEIVNKHQSLTLSTQTSFVLGHLFQRTRMQTGFHMLRCYILIILGGMIYSYILEVHVQDLHQISQTKNSTRMSDGIRIKKIKSKTSKLIVLDPFFHGHLFQYTRKREHPSCIMLHTQIHKG